MSQQNPIRQSLDARLSGLQPSAARRARFRKKRALLPAYYMSSIAKIYETPP